MSSTCRVYWGSHGCSFDSGHDGGVHQCGTADPHWLCEVCCAPRAERTDGEGWLPCVQCHVTSDPYDANPDGVCSRIERLALPGSALTVWVVRYDIGPDPDAPEWSEPHPTTPFGEDFDGP